MKNLFFLVLVACILTNCSSKKGDEDNASTDTVASGTDVGAKLDSLTIWSRLLFRISADEIERLKGNVKGHLTHFDTLNGGTEILLVGKDSTILKKVKVNQNGGFAFNELTKDDYFVILAQENPAIRAELMVAEDHSSLPAENEVLERAYVLKNRLKKLKPDELGEGMSTIQVTLNAPDKKQLADNIILMVVDDENRVVRKVVSNGKKQFVFEKLPPGNYSIIMDNMPAGYTATVKVLDNEPMLTENESLSRTYVIKNTLKKLKSDDFEEGMNTIRVTLKAPNKKMADNVVLMLVDNSNRVVRKVVSNGIHEFVFEKLPPGDYSIVMRNMPAGYTAMVKVVGNDLMLTETESPNLAFVLKNTLKKLKADEFGGDIGRVEVTIKVPNKKKAKLRNLMLVDETHHTVVKKGTPNKKGVYVFENLARGNYALVLPNKPKGAVATVKIISTKPPVKKGKALKDYHIAMVQVPGGTFNMGSLNESDGNYKVTLSSFSISKYEVTQGLWKEVVGMRLSFTIDKKVTPNGQLGGNADLVQTFSDCNECPMENVSWEEAQVFIKRLNETSGKHYALPTEAQWEYAARGGQPYTYAGSNNKDEVAWYKTNSGGKIHPVGQKKPNGYGLYDMTGNADEWCMDAFGDYPTGSATNPTGPASDDRKVVRGGSWSTPARSNTYRTTYPSASQSGGFRIVLLP